MSALIMVIVLIAQGLEVWPTDPSFIGGAMFILLLLIAIANDVFGAIEKIGKILQ